ncbi:transcriptional regulator [Aphanothece hegewaldii CCALA 016]|uniref:Transcriptional regulator n=1 Tax=Aphanothece hegewaldii CCALA 016 TaxID=2107694 RepID=A0A2T1LTQ0_9CHRO|nr:transcriptional regulator [Aphanothece hegewaldii]PSF34480.1 transcriptional regulator [Aphanothece hegewaldii CCALA 016]
MNEVMSFFEEVKRVEIIVNHSYLEKTLRILDEVQVSGYTVIDDTAGKGDRGISCSDIGCAFSGSYVMTVCKDETQLSHLVEKINPILKKGGGVCLVTDAKWVRH